MVESSKLGAFCKEGIANRCAAMVRASKVILLGQFVIALLVASVGFTVLAATNAPSAASDLVLGEYACDESHWNVFARRIEFEPRGYFVLKGDGVYSWLDNGGEGKYRYDAAEQQIIWLTGPLADKQPLRTTYRRNQNTTQIDITFAEDVEWSCGHNLI